jgi:hypothetical protein
MRRLILTVRTCARACLSRAVCAWNVTVELLRWRVRRTSSSFSFGQNHLRRRYAFGAIDREAFERGLRYLRRGQRGPAPGIPREPGRLPAVLSPPEEAGEVKTAIGAARAKLARKEMI